MRILACAAAAALLLSPGSAPSALAQGSGAQGARTAEQPALETPRRRARSTREPTAGQMAARERQKKCGAEWREAKAAGKTAGQKWPQFWSRCNARLKGNSA